MTEQPLRPQTLSDAAQLMLFSTGSGHAAAPAQPSTHGLKSDHLHQVTPAWLGDDMEPDPVCTSEFADHARLLHAKVR